MKLEKDEDKEKHEKELAELKHLHENAIKRMQIKTKEIERLDGQTVTLQQLLDKANNEIDSLREQLA